MSDVRKRYVDCHFTVAAACDRRSEFRKTLASLSWQFAAIANLRFEFKKRGQSFMRSHNETLSVVAMRVSNPDRSPVGINR